MKKSEHKQPLVAAQATGFNVVGTPEELAQLLARQIGDSLAKRLSEQLSDNALYIEDCVRTLLREQTGILSNCGWSPRGGVKWQPYQDDKAESQF